MKQTNNALKFLLAQYRAIFKQAFTKGLAPAIILTTALASVSTANAAAIGYDNIKDASETPVVVTGKDVDSSLTVATPESGSWNANVEVNGGQPNATGGSGKNVITHGSEDKDGKLSGDGTLTIKTGDVSNGLMLTVSKSKALDIEIAGLDIQSGILDITSVSGSSSGATTFGATTITIGDGTLTSSKPDAKVSLSGAAVKSGAQLGNFTAVGAGSTPVGSVITLKNDGVIEFKGHAILDGLKLDGQGGKLDFTAGDGTIKAGSYFENDENGQPGVINIDVAKGKTTTIALNADANNNRGVLHFGSGSVIDLQGGSDASGGQMLISSGSATGSIVRIDNGVTLTNSTDATSGSFIKVVGKGADNEYEKSVLSIDDVPLVNFLTTAGGKADDSGKETTDKAGGIVLAGNAVLDLTSDNPDMVFDLGAKTVGSAENLTNLVFADDAGTANPAVGKIGVSGASNSVKGVNIQVSSAIGATTNKIDVDAQHLILGSATYSGTGSLNFKSAKASDDVTFNASGDSFTLADTVTLDRPMYNQVDGINQVNADGTPSLNTVGKILGKNLTISGAAASGLKVTGGAWETTGQDIVLSTSGALSVQAAKDTGSSSTYNNDGNPASLTIKGGTLTLGNDANAKIEAIGASGANAVLDLSQVGKVEFKNTAADKIEASGSLVDVSSFKADSGADKLYANAFQGKVGYGQIILNSATLSNYLNNSKTTLDVKSGGLLTVSDFSSMDFNVTNFSGAAAAGKIALTGGDVVLDGTVNITSTADTDKLNLGSGTLHAKNVNLSAYKDTNFTLNESGAAFNQGTLRVTESLTSVNDLVTIGANSSGASLILDAGQSGSGVIATNGEQSKFVLDGGTSKFGAINVKSGTWNTSSDIEVTESGAGALANATDVALSIGENASFTADNFLAAGVNSSINGNVLSVAKTGEATFNTMQIGSGDKIDVQGHLTINGRADISETTAEGAVADPASKAFATNGVSLSNAKFTISGAGAILEFGKDASSKLVTLSEDGKTVSLAAGGIVDATLTANNYGQLKFNLEGKYTTENVTQLMTALKFDKAGTGYLNLGNVDIDLGLTPDSTAGENFYNATWSSVKDFANVVGGKATTDKLMCTKITGITTADQVKGHYGALEVSGLMAGNMLTINGATSLHNAAAFGGNFISNGSTAVGANLAQGGSLALENGGTIGSIKGNNDTSNGSVVNADGSINDKYGSNSVYIYGATGNKTTVAGSITGINSLVVDSALDVQDKITANRLELTSDLTSTGTGAAKSIQVNGGQSQVGSHINTDVFTLGGASSSSNGSGQFDVLGQLTSAQLNVVSDADLRVLGGNVTTADLTLGTGSNSNSGIFVGKDADENAIANEGQFADETKSYSGALEVTGTATLNGGLIAVDPSYGDSTAFASIAKLSSAATAASYSAGSLDGRAYVGQNSVLGFGVTNLETLKSKVAQFQKNGSLLDPASNKDAVGSILYLGKAITLDSNTGITLTAKSNNEFLKDFTTRHNATVGSITEANPVLKNTILLGANSAILMDASALTKADTANGENTVGAITFKGDASVTGSKGQVLADGGDVIIDGKVRARTYQVFSNADIKYLDGTQYAIVTDSTAANYDNNINVSTTNHFLEGVLDADGTVKLGLGSGARVIASNVSTPVYDTLVTYAKGYYGDAAEVTPPTTEDKPNSDTNTKAAANSTENSTPNNGTVIPGVSDSALLYTYDANGAKTYEYFNPLLEEATTVGDGTSVEAAARMVAYGGVAEATLAASSSITDAVAGRLGMGGVQTNLNIADNTQGTSLWVAPLYKSHNSSGFSAQGLNSGTDLDLYGLSLGTDHAVNDSIKVGAAFAVGSGDAKGKGNSAASLVKNDFNYYGVSAYGSYAINDITVIGDLSYAVVDNDLTANTSYDKLSSSLNSSALSLGVTGKYSLVVADGLEVAPHAGLRYSHISYDNFTLNDSSNNEIARFTNKNQNIFSIPVGVTLAKTFESDTFTVKPSFDLTITGNFGDKKANSTVDWAGIQNLSTDIKSEIIDSVTYGATVGVALQSGNFNVGAGINYTGSSNTDDLGVSANVRYVF